MTEKFQNKYRVPSARAVWWDYSQPGAYFVTICTHDRSHSFGEIICRDVACGTDVACNVSTQKMELSQIGKYAQQYWNEIPEHFPHVQLGAFQVMPNHIHGIIIIGDVETMHVSSLQEPTVDYKFMSSISPKSGSLARILGSYKSAVSKSAHLINPSFEWQERFHDHIIRDEDEFNRIQEYIINNPKNWAKDRFYNDNQPKNDDDSNGRDDACIVSTPQLPPPTNKYWLVKFAPFRVSWQDILRNGKFEIYSVRNAQARNNLKSMQLDDEVLFYHSQECNCVMGRMKVVEEAHQDKTTADPRWVSVTFEPVMTFETPISLQEIKDQKPLENIGLIKQPRLAVMPLSNDEFHLIQKLKMTESDLQILLQELCSQPREQQWLEFKLNKGSITNEQIGEYISAMSNGATITNKPFGYLVWGVEDETIIVKGTNFTFANAKQGNQDLELWLRNLLYPKINFEIFEFDYQGKHIVLLRIPSAKGEPTNFQKKPFIRIGSNKTDLRNHANFVRIIYNSQEDWSAKTIDSASINNLDEDALKVAREKFKEKSSRTSFFDEIDNWDTATFLDKAKITINGKITNTAIILLGKEEASHYLLPAIAEITWKLETEEKAYEHFGTPLLLNTTKVLQNIRNVKYKFFPDNELLATTVNKYDTRSILEAMHNCIAHQDYSFHSRIIVTEKIDKLIFSNAGSFFEGNPDEYSEGEKTPERYRNPWLANAMVNLGMIDRLGYGIHTMYVAQRNRFFPLPDYLLSESQKVVLQIYGHAIDENYSKLLIERKDLSLSQVVLLDRVQKKLTITEPAATALKKEHLIEGRRPNYYVAASVAAVTDDKASYIKNKAFDKAYYRKLIIEFLTKYKQVTRAEIDDLLLEKLSNVLSTDQKRTKIRNLLYDMSKKEGVIQNVSKSTANPIWVLTNKIEKDKI